MNSIGRLGNANSMVEFLTTNNDERASELAMELEKLNFHRKMASESIFRGAVRQLEQTPELVEYPILVLAGNNWQAGINGIVASRLASQFNKPALVITKEPEGIAHGSARSIAGINIFQLINLQKDILLNYGGHPMAAGFSLKTEFVEQFRERINTSFQNIYPKASLQNDLRIDAFLTFNSIDEELTGSIEKLAPFGPGNPCIILASRHVQILHHTRIGKSRDHLKITARDSTGNSLDILWWNGDETLLPDDEIDLAYTVRAQGFGQNSNIQLEWVDWREAFREKISIRQSQYEIRDLRFESQDVVLKELQTRQESEMVIWGEGKEFEGLSVLNRTQLSPAKTLVILTIPPSREILQHALEIVKPKEIWLGDVDSRMDKIINFQHRLMGLLNYTLSKKNGIVEKNLLAALTSQTLPAIETGIRLITTQGSITLEDSDEKRLKIGRGGVKDEKREKKYLKELEWILRENESFRHFYRSADPDQLFSK